MQGVTGLSSCLKQLIFFENDCLGVVLCRSTFEYFMYHAFAYLLYQLAMYCTLPLEQVSMK